MKERALHVSVLKYNIDKESPFNRNLEIIAFKLNL